MDFEIEKDYDFGSEFEDPFARQKILEDILSEQKESSLKKTRPLSIDETFWDMKLKNSQNLEEKHK